MIINISRSFNYKHEKDENICLLNNFDDLIEFWRKNQIGYWVENFHSCIIIQYRLSTFSLNIQPKYLLCKWMQYFRLFNLQSRFYLKYLPQSSIKYWIKFELSLFFFDEAFISMKHESSLLNLMSHSFDKLFHYYSSKS